MASSDDPAPENNHVSVLARQARNPPTHFFFPHNPSPRTYYFSAPPQIYFISDIYLPPPPSIWVYYPLWYINPNPNVYESTQELPQRYSPNPSQEMTLPPTSSRRVFGRRSYELCEKVTWRTSIKPEVESNGDHITTVMLRNIPNRYTREMMIQFMDKHCEEANKSGKNEEFTISAYDFIYLPIDFRTTMNKGYAFVNFTNAKAVSKFKAACNNKPWCHFYSKKELEITYARIQANELVKRFQHMTYPEEAYSAVCFSPARSGGKDTVQTTMVGKCNEPDGKEKTQTPNQIQVKF
ncbi:putative mei2-like protein [Arabidopsis thaliana]|uniref:MEI2 C-terminal RRM only like 2 n=2 Tax=Arabidopsis TaxID=3701 RepID=F4K9I2_ARATH|nr:MEI2 C-terminal RRM only like 2 [Arabidopsis thaliana]AED91224.1 MEI2 C-terminal RRM only like 2 [Arabidopsis thaliana]KAG7601558.1 Mei2/Mei2-like C-terminal RNA recognition motif [Arabidopsis thaliana x Arabidopsis arenosa]|eukprot:NP_001190253.1 MEI2 C-terminal RRM only like 2 [Arabidopsis thaliana]